MVTRPKLFRSVVAVLFLSAAILCIARATNEPAPRFNAVTTSGEKFNNANIKGKVVLIEFWTTWCKFCVAEADYVDKLDKEYRDKGLIVLAINVGEPKKLVKKYLEQHPRTCRIVLMEDTNLAAMYEATVYPIYVTIDKDGNISDEQRGAGGEEALRRMLAIAGIGGKPDTVYE
jgi:thiol-disulfide isomerase/thioredoxin